MSQAQGVGIWGDGREGAPRQAQLLQATVQQRVFWHGEPGGRRGAREGLVGVCQHRQRRRRQKTAGSPTSPPQLACGHQEWD